MQSRMFIKILYSRMQDMNKRLHNILKTTYITKSCFIINLKNKWYEKMDLSRSCPPDVRRSYNLHQLCRH